MSARWLEHRIPPPVVAILVAAAMWAAAALPPPLSLAPAWRDGLAAALAAAGIGFDLLGLLGFVRSRTTINPMKPARASALVTGGVYRVSRNPMYLGLALLLTGWAIRLAALWPFIGPLLFVLYINRFQIEPEERALADRFGPSFDDYAARVRRWL